MKEITKSTISNLFENWEWNIFNEDEQKYAIWQILKGIIYDEYPIKWDISLSVKFDTEEDFYEIILYIEAKNWLEYYIIIDTIEFYNWDSDVYKWVDNLLSKWNSSIEFLYSKLTY